METSVMMSEHAPSPKAAARKSSDASDTSSSCSSAAGAFEAGGSFPPALDPMVSMVVGSLRQRVNLSAVRPLASLVGVGEAEPFGVPAQAQMLTRMRVNAHYFFANYLLATLFVFGFLLLFFHPIQLLACIAVAYGWFVFLTKEHVLPGHLVIYGKRVGEQEVLLFATAATGVFLLFFILPTIIFSLSMTSLGCSLHAVLRNTRLKDDAYASPRVSKPQTAADNLV